VGSQRIVLTSPWRLGLFVFILVVGCGFGLIYAYLQFFGGTLQFTDQRSVTAFYGVAGGVALLGLLGYLAVVSAAQPLDKVVSGGKRRQTLLKDLARVEDPRELDGPAYEADPDLAAIVERWRAHRVSGCEAEEALSRQREALSALVTQLRQAAETGTPIAAEGAEGAMAALAGTANRLITEIGELRAAHGHAGSAVTAMREAWHEGSARLHRHYRDLQRFAATIASNSQQLSQVSAAGPASTASGPRLAVPSAEDLLLDSNLGTTCQRNRDRIAALRGQLEALSEEANGLAINAALQVSRMGDHGAHLLPVTEQVRAVSTRFQKAAADLRVCEYDQEATSTQIQGLLARVARDWSRLAAGTPSASGPAPAGGAELAHLVNSIGHAAAGLDQLAQILSSELHALDTRLGEPKASGAMLEVGLEPHEVPGARELGSASVRAATLDPSMAAGRPASPELTPEEQLARIHQELFASGSAVDEPARPPQTPAAHGEAKAHERVYDLSEFGAVQLEDELDDGDSRVFDLSELGAVQV
jgi:hypothetical protein